MKALILEGPGRVRHGEADVPPSRNECLIRVRLAGVCGTDLQLLEGYADFRGIPGHEFVGIVESAPELDAHWVGRRVVGEINVGCGACMWCRRGEKEHCPARTVVGIRGRDGAFAEYLKLPAANLHAIPDSIDDRTAVFVEPVAAACRILEQLDLDERPRVAVLGDGRLALLVGQVLKTRVADVTIVGRHHEKMAMARRLGVEARPAALDRDARAFDVVVEATGRGEALAEAVDLVRPRGIVVLKSTVHGAVPVATWPMVVNEVTAIGSRCGPFAPAIALLASGAVRVEPLIAATYGLDEHALAFAQARRGLKVLFAVPPLPGG